MTKKIKVMVLGDTILGISGVGNQLRYICKALAGSGHFQVVQLGGAVKHHDYTPKKIKDFGDDLVIYPIDGYGDAKAVRSIIRAERPDICLFMTDPRYFVWLWQMEDEVRPLMPMVYYHVWDNKPYPKFNARFYNSTDVVVSISKLTSEIVRHVAPDVEEHYLPHAVDSKIFFPLPDEEVASFREKHLGPESKRTVFFWNNKNTHRKQPGTLIYWFNEFLNRNGRDTACLIVHTDPDSRAGQNIEAVIRDCGANGDEIMISNTKYSEADLAKIYNLADCTINISDAEGFGLSTLESLSCARPIIVNMTGGLQEQVTDGENWFGVGLEPVSKAVVGSQEVPYIFEDRVGQEDFMAALKKIVDMGPEARRELGDAGRKYVEHYYGFDDFRAKWVDLLLDVHKRYGSWDTRVGYDRFEILEF
jgi:glycosyltransferase involved in cell wall biosynthesis